MIDGLDELLPGDDPCSYCQKKHVPDAVGSYFLCEDCKKIPEAQEKYKNAHKIDFPEVEPGNPWFDDDE